MFGAPHLDSLVQKGSPPGKCWSQPGLGSTTPEYPRMTQKHSWFFYHLTILISAASDLQTRRYIYEPHWKLDWLSIQEGGLQGIHQWRICGDQSPATARAALGTAGYGTDSSSCMGVHTHTHAHKSIRLIPENGGKERSRPTAFSQVRPLPALPLSGSMLCAQPIQRIVIERLPDNMQQESLSPGQSNLSVALKFFATALLRQEILIWCLRTAGWVFA